jgi:sulfonate transport system permease protein
MGGRRGRQRPAAARARSRARRRRGAAAVRATCFPVYLNTLAGIRSIDRSYHELSRSLELQRWTVLRRVVLPGFLAGLRYSLTLAWLVLVVSEQINATSGVGELMADARQFFRTDLMFVCLFIYGCLGWLSDRFVRTLERRMLSWRREFGRP